LGEIGDRKGIWDIISVIAKYKDELSPCFELVIGGNGDVRKLNERIKKYNLSKMVTFLGWIRGNDKHEALLDSDLYLLPSYNEGLPISVLEAMSYQLPIISTNVGGIPQIVRNFENGILIQPGDQKELLESLRYFISNRDKLITFGKRSEELSNEYLPEKVINKLEIIYQNILGDRRK
jgi:glycosyltransferase involved in cell wall biosynthesis